MTAPADPAPSTVHPERRVPVKGGTRYVVIRPWSMALRRQVKPLLLSVAKRLEIRDLATAGNAIAALFDQIEEELYQIAQLTLGLTEAEMEEQLDWEDLPTLVQATIEICLLRADGGGLAGKLLRVLAVPAMRGRTAGAPAADASPNPPSATPISSGSKPPASLSSPGAGEPTPTASAGC